MGSAPQLVSSALSASASSLSSVVIGEVKLSSSFREPETSQNSSSMPSKEC